MKGNEKDVSVNVLVAHIDKHIDLLEEGMHQIDGCEKSDIPLLGRTPRAGILLAGLLENYYTCIETVFVRISQFFENNLPPDRWHRELLERMTLDVSGTRPRVISDKTFNDLLELMRFRHFKRYYFGTAYDWERLDELLVRIKRSHPLLREDLQEFRQILLQSQG